MTKAGSVSIGVGLYADLSEQLSNLTALRPLICFPAAFSMTNLIRSRSRPGFEATPTHPRA